VSFPAHLALATNAQAWRPIGLPPTGDLVVCRQATLDRQARRVQGLRRRNLYDPTNADRGPRQARFSAKLRKLSHRGPLGFWAVLPSGGEYQPVSGSAPAAAVVGEGNQGDFRLLQAKLCSKVIRSPLNLPRRRAVAAQPVLMHLA